MTRKAIFPAKISLLALALGGSSACFGEGMNATEFRSAVDEVVAEGQAQSLENGVIEITTSFTIGGALEDIAQEIRDFLASQAACSSTTVEVADDVTIAIDFGELGDGCVYNGHTYAGVVTITVAREGDTIEVDHDFAGLTDGVITLDGHKTVVWSEAEGTVERQITSDLAWDRSDRHVDQHSERVMRFPDWGTGYAQRIQIDGFHEWTSSKSGTWRLDVDEVELRLVDPVPQDGSYTLTSPEAKELTLAFERVDDDTIAVTAQSGWRSRVFHVTSAGGVMDVGEG